MHSASDSAAWAACLSVFERELTPQQFTTWIKPLACSDAPGRLRLVAPNRFVLQWVKERFGGRIEALAREAVGEDVAVEFAVADTAAKAQASQPKPAVAGDEARKAADETPAATPAPARAPTANGPGAGSPPSMGPLAIKPGGARRGEPGGLNPGFTFQAFVAGKANQLARAAGLQIAEHPTSYNPLFVYGGVGLGKTHLIQAIGHQLLLQNPEAKIRYIHAETYVSDVVRAYQHKAFDDFKRHYRTLDLLLIDDIQFFGGKSRTQEEFFYLFNTLIEAHQQVVITCDTFPKEIEGIEERLISRFGWGLTVALEPPELEMRVAILLSKAASVGVRARRAGRVLHRQAHPQQRARARGRAQANPRLRELPRPGNHARDDQGSAARPARRAESADLDRQHPEDGRRLLQARASPTCTPRSAHAPSPGRARSRWRWQRNSRSCRCRRSASNFGGRDHTTVLHACRQIAKLRDSMPELNHDVNFLLQVLRS